MVRLNSKNGKTWPDLEILRSKKKMRSKAEGEAPVDAQIAVFNDWTGHRVTHWGP